MSKIRVGIIGLGRIGYAWGLDEKRHQPASHYHAWKARDDCEVVGVCDADSLTAEKRCIKEHAEVFTSFEKMLSDVECDVLSIATPPEQHALQVKIASRYHPVKILFVEKPFCLDAEEGLMALEMAESMGVRVVVNFSRRWDPYWKTAVDQVRAMKPTHLIGVCNRKLEDSGIHMFDLFRWVGCPSHDYVDLSMQPSRGLVFHLEAYGEDGAAFLDNEKAHLYEYMPSQQDNMLRLGMVKAMHAEKYYKAGPTPMQNAVENIVRALKDSAVPLACTGRDGYEAFKLSTELKP